VVRVTAQEVKWLTATWSRQWQRPPNQQELRGLVTDYLKESLLAREAVEMGLDENDTIVRRRLAQKVEFLVQDTARFDEPGDEVLQQFYAADPDRYHAPACISFEQIFFKTETAARQALEAIATINAAELGDRSLLEREFSRAEEPVVAAQFGREFARELFASEPGAWRGPVASAFGFHLVRVSERETVTLRPFAEVRIQVLEEWRRTQEARASEQFLVALMKKYEVVVDESVRSLIGSLGGDSTEGNEGNGVVK
jgi:hypothetical protein